MPHVRPGKIEVFSLFVMMRLFVMPCEVFLLSVMMCLSVMPCELFFLFVMMCRRPEDPVTGSCLHDVT